MSPKISGPTAPLYRREPWLAALILGAIITAAAFVLPAGVRHYAMYPAGLCLLGGIILLARHRPDPEEERAWRGQSD